MSNKSIILNKLLQGQVITSLWGRTYLNTSDIRKYVSDIGKTVKISKETVVSKHTKKRYKKYWISEYDRQNYLQKSN